MTRFVQLKIALAMALVGLASANAQAGSFSLSTVVSASYDLAFTPDAVTRDHTVNSGVPGIWQVDVYMTVDGLEATEAGFANTGFNATYDGIDDPGDLGWQANGQQVDTNGALPGGNAPLFATNVDAGVVGDEKGILVSIAGGVVGPNDPRRRVGQAGGLPGLLGSLFIQWDGDGVDPTGPGDFLVLEDILFQSNSLTGQFGNTVPGAPVALQFGVDVPEPCSLALLGSCFAGLILRRRVA